MIFIINNLKYDTDKMELISDKTRVPSINVPRRGYVSSEIYKSKKSRYLEVYANPWEYEGRALSEEEVKKKLMKYDVSKYEELFGEIEEA